MKITSRKNLKIPKQSLQARPEKEEVTLEFKRWLKKFMNEHDDALRELAKR